MVFDIYAFADYSGAADPAIQHKAIAWSIEDLPSQESHLVTKLTRQTLNEQVLLLLRRATHQGSRVIFGYDHCYSFPQGFYEAVHRVEWKQWRELLTWFHDELRKVSPADREVNPRIWAHQINQLFVERDGLATGPFWGPNFTPLTRQFTYGIPVPHVPDIDWHERRLVESRIRALKNIYQLGGAGSVGLQSLFGIYYIAELLQACKAEHIQIHVWPYDGWEIPDNTHVLVEVYATLYLGKSAGKRTDSGDALACSKWVYAKDQAGELMSYFNPQRLSLSHAEMKRVQLEGWVLGV